MRVRVPGPAGWGGVFVLIAALVVGGLAWVTVASLRVEAAQQEATARAERANQERVALWRLDGHLLPVLGLENNRPFGHYSTLYTQYPVWDAGQDAPAAGSLQLASPLLSADLPPWMLLHFQLDPDRGWESPQVVPPELSDRLLTNFNLTLTNVTPQRVQVLADLRSRFPVSNTLATLTERERTTPDDNPFVVPVPLADETVTPKPRGLVPGDDAPGQSRPYGSGRELIVAPPAEILSKLSHERPTIAYESLGRGRSNGIVVPSFGATAGAMPETVPSIPPPPAAIPGGGGAMLKPYTLSPSTNAQVPAQAMPPGKTESQEQNQGGEYAARSRVTQEAVKTRGALQNNTQAMKPGPGNTVAVPQGTAEGAKQTEPAAPSPLPAGPPAPGTRRLKPNESSRESPRDKTPAMSEPKRADPQSAESEKSAEKKVQPADRTQPKKPAPTMMSRPGNGGAGGPSPLAGPAIEGGMPGGLTKPDASNKDSTKHQLESSLKGGGNRVEGLESATQPATLSSGPDEIVRGSKKAAPTVQPVNVQVGPLRPVWLTARDGAEALALVRAARLEGKIVFQGVLLDWPQLRSVLGEQIVDLLPAATLLPIHDADPPIPERAMTALPVQLDPGPMPEPQPAGWTALRIGLLMAWAAALLGLTAVGVGGRTLVDLSERRIRFVSAVTHELRTPLTSLRLYLDLLTSGMIEDETKKREYLGTLANESERLHRLIENVLDFARLERRSVEAHMQPIKAGEILEDVRQTWVERCAADGRELVVISTVPADFQVTTDMRMVTQVLGNLVDNARKYTRDAVDSRIWVWAKPGDRGAILLEVEDRGPGVSAGERATIFRPFRRGKDADTTAGGAGLGLALAKHWSDLLGGSLSYRVADGGTGACFRLELPLKS